MDRLMRNLTPIQMLFIFGAVILGLTAIAVIAGVIESQLAVVIPLASVLLTAYSATVGGIVLFIKLSEPRKPGDKQ